MNLEDQLIKGVKLLEVEIKFSFPDGANVKVVTINGFLSPYYTNAEEMFSRLAAAAKQELLKISNTLSPQLKKIIESWVKPDASYHPQYGYRGRVTDKQ